MSAVGSTRSARALDITIRLCATLWSVWLITLWDPAPFAQGPLDASYTIFSHIAFAEGRPWGSGALHTSGPLGFLRFPFFHPQTYPLLLLSGAALATTLALLLDEVARRNLRTWCRLPLVVAVTWLLSFNDDAGWLLVLLMSQLFIPIVTRSHRWCLQPDVRWFTWPLLLDLVMCAIVANAKGTFLLMGAIVAGEVAALEVWGRRPPVVSAGFILLVALFAHLSGFQVTDWQPYTRHVMGSLRGYPESFSTTGSPMLAVLLISSVLAFLALAAASARRSASRTEAIIRWGTLAALLWIVAKGALLRQDRAHEVRAIMALGVFLVAYVVSHRRDWRLHTKTLSLLPMLGVAAMCVVPKSEPPPGPPRTERHVKTFISFLREGTATPAARDAQARREVASEIRSPWPPSSTVAVFGTYQSLLLGHPGQHVNLPFVAPYEIWSTWASRREREFLLGPAAPDYLLYTTSPTSAELALTLAVRYAEVERGPRHSLLQRRPVPLTVKNCVVFERDVEAGDIIDIPPKWQSWAAVAQVRYTKTFTNTLISSLYQPPEAFLVLFRGQTPFAKVRMSVFLSAEGIVLPTQPGTWDGSPRALHGMRFGLLTDERTEATALGFEARGVAGDQWTRYFGPKLHLRIYLPEFESGTNASTNATDRPSHQLPPTSPGGKSEVDCLQATIIPST